MGNVMALSIKRGARLKFSGQCKHGTRYNLGSNKGGSMGENVTIAVKRGGSSRSGVGYKGLARLANSMSLLRGESVAWDALFAPEGPNDYLERLAHNAQAPTGYGIVCIDLDAKRIDSHQGYGTIGSADMDSRRELLICLGLEILPHPLEDSGILLDAYMGGALVPKGGSALVCAESDPKRAAHALIKRLEGVGDFQIFTDMAIKPPGWEVVKWNRAGHGHGMFEMAQSLAGHGWPMGAEVLMGWRAFLVEEGDLPEEAARFDAWIESMQVSAELSAQSAGQVLPRGPQLRV